MTDHWLLLTPLCFLLALLIAGCTAASPAAQPSPAITRTPRPTFTPRATPTSTRLPTMIATPSPTPANTPLAIGEPEGETARVRIFQEEVAARRTATAQARNAATATPPASQITGADNGLKASSVPHEQGQRLVLGNYFVWYDAAGWDGCNISDGDRPQIPYNSDDPEAMRRHVGQARDAGLDGFTAQWFAPGERTDQNFARLLDVSRGQDFHSTVVFLRHIWPGAPRPTTANVADALRYILDRYGGHDSFLRWKGKPVIFFADIYRVPHAGGQTAQQAWQAIRQQADPQHQSWWIAEGLDPSYLAVFDGLYVYKVTHAAYPDDYRKDSRWAQNVRRWEQRTGQTKLWIATLMPGWDDRRAGCRPNVRVPSQPHKRDRENGAFYRATFDAALQSNPDWLWINSFNEWVEGTYIEPSAHYGDRYLQETKQLVLSWKKEDHGR
ncbi:MAG: hypothetical protein GXP41_00770 [Chloroflexi bacterium]|nr:hypothetical protein [Chloroflexota bacterium]